jgi:hypothetical protein
MIVGTPRRSRGAASSIAAHANHYGCAFARIASRGCAARRAGTVRVRFTGRLKRRAKVRMLGKAASKRGDEAAGIHDPREALVDGTPAQGQCQARREDCAARLPAGAVQGRTAEVVRMGRVRQPRMLARRSGAPRDPVPARLVLAGAACRQVAGTSRAAWWWAWLQNDKERVLSAPQEMSRRDASGRIVLASEPRSVS